MSPGLRSTPALRAAGAGARRPSDRGRGRRPVDVVLIAVDADTDARAVLAAWKPRLVPDGGIWLLTPKRTQPGYVDQRLLIEAGLDVGLVDNKSISVSDSTSGMRWVIRRPGPTCAIVCPRAAAPARSSSGPGRHPLKVEIAGSNPARVTPAK